MLVTNSENILNNSGSWRMVVVFFERENLVSGLGAWEEGFSLVFEFSSFLVSMGHSSNPV